MNKPKPEIDHAKRARVMRRSQELGHCICDPRQPCPCPVFLDQDLCPCAGERAAPAPAGTVPLTSLVHNAGCASKIPPADLEAVLRRLPEVHDPAVISGLAAADDAAIYQIADGLCLVQTVDVFTPCVDDPRLFGRICAANCLSDIYAMGGTPRTALSILGFPSDRLDGEIMFQMLAGAMETLAEAGVALVGGHSIKDEEIKLGFAVTGTIDPAAARALDQPQAGDILVLTKPLGTGVLAFAHQIGRGHPKGYAAAAESMAALNRPAAQAMLAAGATACTDITGFGLFGHLLRMLTAARLGARIHASALPAFPGALEALRQDIIPGAIERNREFAGASVEAQEDAREAYINLGFDAQTSGGLLIAVPPARAATLLQELGRRGATGWIIGELLPPRPRPILVTGQELQLPSTSSNPPMQSNPAATACACGGASTASTAEESQRAFRDFVRSARSGGAVDARTKELMLISLVVYSRCAPCLEAHLQTAREMGISQGELDEAAWCAILMGGAPVRMFYQEHMNQRAAGAARPCCG